MQKTTSHNFFGIKMVGQPHWGIVCRVVPYSKSRVSLVAPPPTTMIGALAYSLARMEKWPEVLMKENNQMSGAERIRGMIKSVHVKLNFSLMEHADIGRVFWYHYARKEAKFDAVALEKVYVFPLKKERIPLLEAIYIIDSDFAEKLLGEKWREKLEVAAWTISRIGQKESMITILDVKTSDSIEVFQKVDSEVTTSYYFPVDAASSIYSPSNDFLITHFVDPISTPYGDYGAAERIGFVIPYSRRESRPINLRVIISEKGVVIKAFNTTLISLRRWIFA